MKGIVFDLKKFAVHDGPGIRSTLFLKGCPLRCVWCQNPEGIHQETRLWYFEQKCIKCSACVTVCPQKALSVSATSGKNSPWISIDRNLCTSCGKCVEVCPTTALSFDSYTIDSEAVIKRFLQDKDFYDQSAGGITLSGGEPLFQPDFSREVLGKCKAHGIHTAMETCMFANKEVLLSFIGLVDLFIVDLKLFDEAEHQRYIGTGNTIIKENFRLLVEAGQHLLVRIPLIPRITAKEENLRAIARFVRVISPETPIELINFNPLAVNKYRLMDEANTILAEMRPYSARDFESFYDLLTQEGVNTRREVPIP